MIFSNREYIEIRNSNLESNLFAFHVLKNSDLFQGVGL